MNYSVYMLRDPRTMVVHYVGISVNAISRFQNHLNADGPIARWIGELKQLGLKPILDIRLTKLSLHQAMRAESILVCKLRECGATLFQGHVSRQVNPKKQLQQVLDSLQHVANSDLDKVAEAIAARKAVKV